MSAGRFTVGWIDEENDSRSKRLAEQVTIKENMIGRLLPENDSCSGFSFPAL